MSEGDSLVIRLTYSIHFMSSTSIEKSVSPRDVDGWKKVKPFLVDHCNKRPINYIISEPELGSSKKAVFYLHGLGGGYKETTSIEHLVCSYLGYNFVRLEQPLMTIDDPLQLVSTAVGINPGTLFQLFHNTSKLVNEVAKVEEFEKVATVGISYGGLSSIVNIIRENVVSKSFISISTPDIALAIERFDKLFDSTVEKKFAKVLSRNFRVEGRNIRDGGGLFRNYWNDINPWVDPSNYSAEVMYVGNENDPIMSSGSIEHYKKWMSKNHGFDNVEINLYSGKKLTKLCL